MKTITLSAREMAEAFGLAISTVTRHARDGLFVKLKRDEYDLLQSTFRYSEHMREVAAGRGGKETVELLSTERARLAKEQADGHAIKNAQLRKELVTVADVEVTWSGMMRDVRAAMLAITPRFQARVQSLTRQQVEILDGEIRAALTAMGEDKGTVAD